MRGVFLALIAAVLAVLPVGPVLGLTQAGREARDLICRKNIRLSENAVYGYREMTAFVYYEDGAGKLLRTGYEVALFRRLKQRFRQRAPPLTQKRLLHETIDVMIGQRRDRQPVGPWNIELADVLLTAHNVTRLLARPEQWVGDRFDPGRGLHVTDGGENRYVADSAFPIILDLRGIHSVDDGPTMRALAMNRGSFQGEWINEEFFGPRGVFVFHHDMVMQPRAVDERKARGWTAAHWNGGIHYYYFVGALASFYGSRVGASASGWMEGWVKWLMGDVVRYEVQSQYGFHAGASDYRQLDAGLRELSDDDRRCLTSPPTPVVPPPPDAGNMGIECQWFVSSTTGREICVCRDLRTGRILTTPAVRSGCGPRR